MASVPPRCLRSFHGADRGWLRQGEGGPMPSLIAERLPVRLTPLVGRQHELRDVVDSLSGGRLLTLTGPGGIGKTRLALAAAGAVSTCYPEGVCWVELVPLDDPGIVAGVVARRLGVPDCPGQDAVAAIAEHVGDGSVLIVLDNCEHLASAVADFAGQLLGACPALSVLAACRWRSSWPRPRCGCCPSASWLSAWTTFSWCWSVARARPRTATRPCGRPWTGAMTCWARASAWFSAGWLCSRAASRWPRLSRWPPGAASARRGCWSC